MIVLSKCPAHLYYTDKCKEVTMFTKGYTALSLLDSPQNVNGVTLFLR